MTVIQTSQPSSTARYSDATGDCLTLPRRKSRPPAGEQGSQVEMCEVSSVGSAAKGNLRITLLIGDALMGKLRDHFAANPSDKLSTPTLVKQLKKIGLELGLLATTPSNAELAAGETDGGAVRFMLSYLRDKGLNYYESSPAWIRIVSPTAGELTGRPARSSFFIEAKRLVQEASEVAEKNESVRPLLKLARKSLRDFAMVDELHRIGTPILSIASQLEVTDRTVRTWILGGLPRSFIDLKDCLAKLSRPKIMTVPIEPVVSVPLAALVGSFQAISWHERKPESLQVHFATQEAADLARNYLIRLDTGVGPIQVHDSRKGMVHTFPIYPPEFRRGLEQLTENNSRIPWEILGSREEKLAYVAAFLSCKGGIIDGRFYVKCEKHPSLVVHLGLLFESLGIPVDIQENGTRHDLVVSSLYGISQMSSLGILTPKMNARVLEALGGKADFEHPCALYDRFLTERDKDPTLSTRELATRLNLPYRTVNQWKKGIASPLAVQARAKLAEWRDILHVPHTDVGPYLYRVYQVPLLVAMEVAQKSSMSEVELAIRRLSASGSNIAQTSVEKFVKLSKNPNWATRLEAR